MQSVFNTVGVFIRFLLVPRSYFYGWCAILLRFLRLGFNTVWLLYTAGLVEFHCSVWLGIYAFVL